jgi:hypothetical protein
MGGNNAHGDGRPSFISLRVIDLLRCDASSLSSILRSKLLTTLINE